MSYTPGSGGKIQVGIDAGMTASVTILRKFGGALTVYSDAARTTPVSIPATITANTIFYLDTDDIYTISCISNGVECCSISGVIQVHTKNINGDHQVGCSVDRETSEIAITGNGITLAQANAAFAPLSSLQETIAYNSDGTVHSVTETVSDAVTTYTYNSDGTIATEVRVLAGVTTTRTFGYTSGNLTSVA